MSLGRLVFAFVVISSGVVLAPAAAAQDEQPENNGPHCEPFVVNTGADSQQFPPRVSPPNVWFRPECLPV